MARILCIEDEDALRGFYERILQREGHAVLLAEDGLQGVETYRSNVPLDVVLTDMEMPNADGLYVIREIKQMNPSQRIVLVASCPDYILEKARDLGIDGFLGKPFNISELVDLVKGQ